MDEKTTEASKTVKFTEAELALIDQGIAELDRGEGMTFQQARELARKRTKAWMATSQVSATI
jgi:predicted transcriptional regulator